jgi:dihydrolipoamide dehydrogenase
MAKKPPATDIAIVGAGPGGYVAAIRAGRLGKQVTLIEREPHGAGGICLHHGCIPSKALIHIANVFHEATHSQELGISVSSAQLDFTQTQKFKNKVVTQLTQGIESLLQKAGVEVLTGTATFEKSNQLHIEQEHETLTLTADKIIIATGTKAMELPQLPFDGQQVISSREALEFKQIPSSMAIIGGGYIAIELSHVFQKMGCKVTMLQRSNHILSNADPVVSDIMRKQLSSFGVEILSNTEVSKASVGGGKVSLSLMDKSTQSTSQREFEKVLVATGRVPNYDGLGIENTRVLAGSAWAWLATESAARSMA